MALVKYNNNSISSVTALDSIASGSLVLLTTNTISSGVSSSSFTSNINSTYDTYLFKFINIHPASDSVNFTANFRDGSSAFDAIKTTTFFKAYNNEAGGGHSNLADMYSSSKDLAQSNSYQNICDIVGADADQSVSGQLFLFSPSSTTFVKHFMFIMNGYTSNDYSQNHYIAGYCNTTSAIDGVDFKFASGNIDSGIIKMYGLSKS
jgi:hypothetical protein